MDSLFVIPGILGSEFSLHGRQIWPPSISAATRGLRNPFDLLDPQVQIGGLIGTQFFVFGFYDRLIDQLNAWGYRPGSSMGDVFPWPYDWRADIRDTAQLLAFELDAHAKLFPDRSIVLLAHSMGGLVAKYALECLTGTEHDRWRSKTRLFITFGTPFFGAPKAFANGLGYEGLIGIHKDDAAALMADSRFRAAYQLLPNVDALQTWGAQAPLSTMYSYLGMLGPRGQHLNPHNLTNAQRFAVELHAGVPSPARCFHFCGTSHGTAWAASVVSTGAVALRNSSHAGDGTVPSWSGRLPNAQFAPLGAKHDATFNDADLLNVLYDLLRVPSSGSPPGPGARVRRVRNIPNANDGVGVRLSTTAAAAGSTVSAFLTFPNETMRVGLWWAEIPVDRQDELEQQIPETGLRLHAVTEIQINTGMVSPLELRLPVPQEFGLHALIAVRGEPSRDGLEGLDLRRLEYLWAFDDADRENYESGPETAGPSNLPEQGMTAG